MSRQRTAEEIARLLRELSATWVTRHRKPSVPCVMQSRQTYEGSITDQSGLQFFMCLTILYRVSRLRWTKKRGTPQGHFFQSR
jgi:hypothetical protein